nr:MAG TPA: hypothetical protein [Caudoviricetes sp.]
MMTKQEFDLLFPKGKCVVAASNMDEYLEVHDYAVEKYGVEPSSSRNRHDCRSYPYVFVQPASYMVDATYAQNRGPIILFTEWQEIVSETDENVKLCSANLSDVL